MISMLKSSNLGGADDFCIDESARAWAHGFYSGRRPSELAAALPPRGTVPEISCHSLAAAGAAFVRISVHRECPVSADTVATNLRDMTIRGILRVTGFHWSATPDSIEGFYEDTIKRLIDKHRDTIDETSQIIIRTTTCCFPTSLAAESLAKWRLREAARREAAAAAALAEASRARSAAMRALRLATPSPPSTPAKPWGVG